MKKSNLIIIVFLLLTIPASTQTSQKDFGIREPTDLSKLNKLSLWSTQYYIHKFTSGGEIPIVLSNGKQSGLYANTCDFCEASLEGTAYVTDSLGQVTIINYAKSGEKIFVDCRKCKKYSKSKLKVENWGKALWTKTTGFGDGVQNFKLIPFRTIAVDKRKISYGTVIYIPNVKGRVIELPNGEKVMHDGYFFAGDTGGAIKDYHIDTFTGIYEGNPFPNVITSNPKKTFEAYIITDEEIIKKLKNIQTK